MTGQMVYNQIPRYTQYNKNKKMKQNTINEDFIHIKFLLSPEQLSQ